MGESLIRSAGRPKKISLAGFAREYNSFQSGKYGDISKQQFAELLGMAESTFASYEKRLKDSSGISKQERKELRILADDFRLLHREDVRNIIDNCKSYTEGQQKIMRVYMAVYL